MNWGIGHATRSSVLIEILMRNNEVTIASDGDALIFLKKKHPSLKTVLLPSYGVKYYSNIPLWISISIQLPQIFYAIFREHFTIKSLEYDLVVSDNRYGCFHTKKKSIFITHQLNILSPIKYISTIANKVNSFFINQYDHCWIPDDKVQRLAGVLTQSSLQNTTFIGLLSDITPLDTKDKDIDFLVILSGPEPARSDLENKIISIINNKTYHKVLTIGGSIQSKYVLENSGFEYISFADREELSILISRSMNIICRSGYSTLMDLESANFKGGRYYIPTTGQTEQEYLANYHSSLTKTNTFVIKEIEVQEKLTQLLL